MICVSNRNEVVTILCMFLCNFSGNLLSNRREKNNLKNKMLFYTWTLNHNNFVLVKEKKRSIIKIAEIAFTYLWSSFFFFCWREDFFKFDESERNLKWRNRLKFEFSKEWENDNEERKGYSAQIEVTMANKSLFVLTYPLVNSLPNLML
jgi:hypothetical protein